MLCLVGVFIMKKSWLGTYFCVRKLRLNNISYILLNIYQIEFKHVLTILLPTTNVKFSQNRKMQSWGHYLFVFQFILISFCNLIIIYNTDIFHLTGWVPTTCVWMLPVFFFSWNKYMHKQVQNICVQKKFYYILLLSYNMTLLY